MKIRISFALVSLLFLSTPGHADTVYLKSNVKGNTGKVLEEYPDSIVINSLLKNP